MLSFHAASIMASCVRTKYPSQSGAPDTPKRRPRIRGPDSKNNVDRLSAGIVSVELLTGRTCRVRGFASVPIPFGFIDRPLIKKSWPVHGYAGTSLRGTVILPHSLQCLWIPTHLPPMPQKHVPRHSHTSSTLVEWVGYTMFPAAGA